MACHKKLLDGYESDFSVIGWKPSKLVRMARSSLHVESQAAAAGMGALEFAKWFWAAVIYDEVDITKDECTHMAGESALAVDAMSLGKSLTAERLAMVGGSDAAAPVVGWRRDDRGRWFKMARVRVVSGGSFGRALKVESGMDNRAPCT